MSEEALRKALGAILHWADRKCPCENEEPNPCPLCGASVENLEACKAADKTLPPRLLADIRLALSSPPSPGAMPVAWLYRPKDNPNAGWSVTTNSILAAVEHLNEIRPLYAHPTPSLEGDDAERFEIACDAAQQITNGPRYSNGSLPNGYMTHVIEQAIQRATAAAATRLSTLAADNAALIEWKEAIIGLCRAIGSDDMAWGGDKTGWGFIFYFVKHLHTRAEAAEAELDRFRAMFDSAGNYIPHSQIDGDLRDARAELERMRTKCFGCITSAEHGEALASAKAEKDGAYLERNQVVAALAKCFPSGLKKTDIAGWSTDWHQCVYIDLPTGQVSWHFHDSQAYLFDGLPPYDGEWDGHDTAEKYRRVAALEAS
jgi:hypothetical protein